jgi:PAS domain S-box-containing protein
VLSKQSVLLSTILATSYDPIALLDHDGRIIGANHAFAKLMNASADDIIGKLQSEFIPSDRGDWAERQNKEVLASGESLILKSYFSLVIRKPGTKYIKRHLMMKREIIRVLLLWPEILAHVN